MSLLVASPPSASSASVGSAMAVSAAGIDCWRTMTALVSRNVEGRAESGTETL
jgi:hypothetical protein